METQYDEILDVKKGRTRDERTSSLMAKIHAVPKKVADVAQAQGVSEKFLRNGIPSGVINPSMLAHDRFLSVIDAVQDAIFITVCLPLFAALPFNGITGTLLVLMGLYWIFHIAWWEKAKAWAFKAAAKRYVYQTHHFYWGTLLLLTLPISVGFWWYIFKAGYDIAFVDAGNSILHYVAGAEAALYAAFNNFEWVHNHLSATPHYQIQVSSSGYEINFVTYATVFFTVTILSKYYFSKQAHKEKLFNIETSEDEMKFEGELALQKLVRAQNT